jgi:hypothetical protein
VCSGGASGGASCPYVTRAAPFVGRLIAA